MNSIIKFIVDYARSIVFLAYASVMIPLVTHYYTKPAGYTVVCIVIVTALSAYNLGRLTESNTRMKELNEMAKKDLNLELHVTLTDSGSEELQRMKQYFEFSSIGQVVELALKIHAMIVNAFTAGAKVRVMFDWPDGNTSVVDPIDIILPGYASEEDEEDDEED